MKKLITLATVMMAVCMAGSAFAIIDWAGATWPNNGHAVLPTGPVSVYAQVFKAGVTDIPGQGAGISASLSYTTDIAATVVIPMGFLGDNGVSNDEYTAAIPQTALVGATYVDVMVTFADATDTTSVVATDQAGNQPPLRYTITNALPNDILVHFTLCMSGTPTAGAPCVIGSDPAIGSWGIGATMTLISGDLYDAAVLFAAGSNPNFEYKFKSDGCSNWEGVANRLVSLPTDGTTDVVLAADSWNNAPMGCGMGTTLTADKTVCFQVCMNGVANTGGVCLIGNLPEFGSWGTPVPMTLISADLYQVCLVFPAGTPAPINMEFKFKKDGCTTWENGANQLFTLDDAAPAETTLTHIWEAGNGICGPVPTENANWGSIKTLYR